jgi:3-oxoacyl-[acyl-carrier protein] reductase
MSFGDKNETTIGNLTKVAPLESLGRPEGMAEMVAFLAGPARWVPFGNGGLA